jgi:hypothetical protein
MSSTTYGGNNNSKPKLKLDGKTVIVENIACYDGSVEMTYIREVIYHFETVELAKEYYYKKK